MRLLNQVRPSFEDVLANNTGQEVPTQLWESGQRRFLELQRQSDDLADKLEVEGIKAREGRRTLSVIGEVTGCIEEQRDFRPIRFLPVVAQRERQGMLNALMYFQQNAQGGHYMRYSVVTAGQRIPAYGPLRETIRKLSRDISRWASEALHRFGVEVVYRGTEFTVNSDGTYHPHANVLYVPRRKLAADEWQAFLSWSHKRLGAHWRDCGKLSEPREALKYPFKPNDLQGRPSDEIAWLFGQLFRMKLAQPLSSFKAFWHELEDSKEKIGRLYSSDGKPGALTRIKRQERGSVERSDSPPIEQENRIVCRTSPQARFSPIMEPLTIIENFTRNPTTEGGKIRLFKIEQWQVQAQRYRRQNGEPPDNNDHEPP